MQSRAEFSEKMGENIRPKIKSKTGNPDSSNDGEVVGHIIARSLGGPSHPINYTLMSRVFNAKLLHHYDHIMCVWVGKERLQEILRKSMKIGNMCKSRLPGTNKDFQRYPCKSEDKVEAVAERMWNRGWEQLIEALSTNGAFKKSAPKDFCN